MLFSEWVSAVFSSMPLFCITLLTVGVIFVNGWTDAPNAIASCVVTRALSPGGAVTVSALCNFVGLWVSLRIHGSVTDTVTSIVNFGSDAVSARAGLCAGMFAVVLWAIGAWVFGIPTSESHALLAGLTGAALAVSGEAGSDPEIWRQVLFGLVVSLLFGFFGGWGCTYLVERFFRSDHRRAAGKKLRFLQILGGVANSLLHGAQDGQKFIGVLLLSVSLRSSGSVDVPAWMTVFCASLLALGTSLGGYRIIRSVGMKMVRLTPARGVAADVVCAICLAGCTALGIPVSTTHVKTAAVMGTGATDGIRGIRWKTAGEMCLAWILTFPGCGVLGYGCAKLFSVLFS